MHRSKRKRNIIIFSLVGVLLCMAAGYAAFQTQLKVSGTSKVTSNWDIEITNVTQGTPTGSAENIVAPSWDKLWASMEADLYDKGDAMEYDVTIENKGSLDAKLNDIITNLENSNNDAVIITFSGYTKGEVLKSKATKIIHVKIEYNPEYEGGETSSEVEVNFDYTQNNNEENNPDSQYLLTYDYQTNGGTSVELKEELLQSGSNVDLSNTATKEGWNFVGWNTDKDAEIGLKEYQMPTENTTLYAIYSKTLKVTYEKGDNVESIGKNEDSCNIYNNGISCEVILPEITANDDTATVGWYNGEENIGKPNDKYSISNDITLRAEAEGEPIIQRWMTNPTTDFHAEEEYRTNIITATFLNNKNVPEGATSWDVSAEQDGSVMAWVIQDDTDPSKYHLYIGGNGGVIAHQYSSYLFYNFTNLQTITFGENYDTSNATNMNYMLAGCNNLTSVDVNNLDTSQVTNMSSMFYNCSSLTELDVSKFDTKNVTSMGYMFSGCSSITKLVLCNWNTSKVTTMNYMFNNTSNLNTIYVGQNWTTEKATTTNMFANSGVSSVTQSNNCEVDAEEMSLSISTSSTTNSITVVANAQADSGIAKYEYSKDDGKTWETSTNNTYTFTGLTTGTAYDIKVRVTSNIGKTLEKGVGINITNNIVTSGTGLYEDEYEDGKYTYKGTKPNNYIRFNNELWRILSVESDGSLKIIRNNNIGNITFDTSGGTHGNNNWDRPADIKTYLNNEYFSTITTNKDNISSRTWSIGEVVNGNTDLAGQINDENGTQSQSANVGMITASEYIRANSNKTQCGNMSINNTNCSTCKNTNWIYSLISPSNFLWTISPSTSGNDSVVSIYALISYAGYINNNYASNSYGILPALYLTQQTKIVSGSGTENDPYIIGNGISTSTLEKPTFTERDSSNGKTVTITYSSGCGSSLTCSYQKDNGSIINVTSSSVNVEFTDSGSLVARVSDGTNNVSSSYTVTVPEKIDMGGQKVVLVTSGDGLYEDEYEDGRYVYKGTDPNNYITFNNETWRIISKEADDTYKIMRNESIGKFKYDTLVMGMPVGNNDWARPADLNTYLNSTYLPTISTNSDKIVSHNWNIGKILYNTDDIVGQIADEKGTIWNGKVGLITLSDYIRANPNKEQCGNIVSSNSNSSTCMTTNWMPNTTWTITSHKETTTLVYSISAGYLAMNMYAKTSEDTVPALYLNSNTQLSGTGTQSNPYRIIN